MCKALGPIRESAQLKPESEKRPANSGRANWSASRKMESKTREEMEKIGIIDSWLRKHQLIYIGATRHPFILSIRDGSVDLYCFKTWLGQDYIFVREFVAFAASVLMKACKESDESSDMEVILGAMAALNDEIRWFKNEASKWEIELSGIAPRKATQDYCRFLESLMGKEVEYAVVITAFWAIESVYQESFAHCLEDGNETPPPLLDTCQRWGNRDFGQYCFSLKKIADRWLKKASGDILKKTEVVLLSVLEHEVAFWNMSRVHVAEAEH